MSFSTHRYPIIIGGLFAVITAGFQLVVPTSLRPLLAALLLGAIGPVYVGFGIMDGRWQHITLETIVAFGFLGLATAGLLWSPLFTVAGYILHGVWDYAHHRQIITTTVRAWYPPFCAIYDWTLALLLLALFG